MSVWVQPGRSLSADADPRTRRYAGPAILFSRLPKHFNGTEKTMYAVAPHGCPQSVNGQPEVAQTRITTIRRWALPATNIYCTSPLLGGGLKHLVHMVSALHPL